MCSRVNEGHRVEISSGPVMISPGLPNFELIYLFLLKSFFLKLSGGTFMQQPTIEINNDTVNNVQSAGISSVFKSPSHMNEEDPHIIGEGGCRIEFKLQELFGGAITCDLPPQFRDVSRFRQVPDNQEVFVDKDSDMSIIFEVLEHDEEITDDAAALHYFEDLADCNEATAKTIDAHEVIESINLMPHLANPAYRKCVLIGTQRIVKFSGKDGERDEETEMYSGSTASSSPSLVRADRKADFGTVLIILLALRLPVVGTDLLVTFNAPFDPSIQEHLIGEDILKHLYTEISSPITLETEIMKVAVNSLSIIDWSLFA